MGFLVLYLFINAIYNNKRNLKKEFKKEQTKTTKKESKKTPTFLKIKHVNILLELQIKIDGFIASKSKWPNATCSRCIFVRERCKTH